MVDPGYRAKEFSSPALSLLSAANWPLETVLDIKVLEGNQAKCFGCPPYNFSCPDIIQTAEILLHRHMLVFANEESNSTGKELGLRLGLQHYTGVLVRCDIFCHDMNIVYRTRYRDIYDTFTYASTNTGKHCLQLVLTLLLFSPYARRFSEQTDEKNPC